MDEKNKYFIKFSHKNHSSDVRVVKCYGDGFLTGSRDQLIKFWARNGDEGYKESHNFIGATNYVSSLCILPASTDHPNGVVVAGCHDSLILGFTLESDEPIFRHRGHSGPVCALSNGPGFFVSGSWDKTARVWSDHKTYTLTGHAETVWAVSVYPPDLILTGSADCTIRIWSSFSAGEIYCERTLYGHTDCVRGLAISSEGIILSCGNDGTVRTWDITGQNLNVFFCADNFLYSITLLADETSFAVCSEDNEVCIWEDGACAQTIKIEEKTLWSVAALDNGDIAVGSSDGTVYIIGSNIDVSSLPRHSTGDRALQFKSNPFFPVKEHVYYLSGNVNGMKAKLMEFNDQLPPEARVESSRIEELMVVTTLPDKLEEDQLKCLDMLLEWHKKFLFPVLDLMRYAVRCRAIHEHISPQRLLTYLLNILRTERTQINVILISKIICNMFGIEAVEPALCKFQTKIFELIKECAREFSDSVHKSISNIFLNFAIAAYKKVAIDVEAYCCDVLDSLNGITDPVSLYRMLLAVATLSVSGEFPLQCLREKFVFEYIFDSPKFRASPELENILPLLKASSYTK